MDSKVISMIVAHDPNLVIGRDGSLPWRIPEDMAHFRKRTTGHTIVMGRGVFEELGEKPLPNRRNIVLSRSRSYENVEVCRSLKEVMEKLKDQAKFFVIGGAVIYRLFYPVCNRLEVTRIHREYHGDTFFPEYRHEIGPVWKEVFRDERGDFTFVDFERIRKA